MGLTLNLPLDQLLSLALQSCLIEKYRLEPDRVELTTDLETLTLDPEEARFYLMGLLVGYEHHASESKGRGGG